jgi:predicted  nucleic acid-binding Zn-ribbon protein
MAYLPVLFQIQTIESRLLALKKDEGLARNDPKIVQAEAALKEMGSLGAELESKRHAIQSSNRKLELELKACQEHIAVEEKKLYGGSVTNSRELGQIEQKVVEYKHTASKLEDEILQLMEHDDGLGARISALQKKKASCEQELAALKTASSQKLREISIEVMGLESELSELTPQVREEWLARFHKIAGAHNGIGIAQVKSGNCGACHVSLSDMMLQKVKRGDDVIICCENCGRILYY